MEPTTRTKDRAARSRRAAAVVAVVVLALGAGLAACSDDDDDGGDTESSTTSASTTDETGDETGGGESAPAFIDIVECENVDGSGTASGTVQNTGDDAAAYELTVGVFDLDSGDQLASGTASIDELEPDAEGEWTIEVDGLGDAEVECRTTAITSG